MNHTPLVNLSILIWAPVIASIVIWFLRNVWEGALARLLAQIITVVTALGAFDLLWCFSSAPGAPQFQFVENVAWLPSLGIHYALGCDGLSMVFVALNAVLTLCAVFSCRKSTSNALVAGLLATSGFTVGAFTAMDAAIFYVFFEAMLVPVFVMIGVFGGENRKVATLKFFLFTLFGSLFMLLALFGLYQHFAGTFSIAAWTEGNIPMREQTIFFWLFFIALAVKTPIFPLHAWAPDAYTQGPTSAIVMLASTKIGAYAILRLMIPILPDAARYFAPIIITLSLIAIIYFALVARAQQDLKRFVAYSTLAHMGMVTLGLFLFETIAIRGAVLLMVANALTAAAMFLSMGALTRRLASRKISDFKGLAGVMPVFSTLFVFFALANVALPGTANFAGEILVILGAVQHHLGVGLLAATVLILGAFYTLGLVRHVIFGKIPEGAPIAKLKDLAPRECVVLGVLAALILLIGVYPQPLLHILDGSVLPVLQHAMAGKL
jgi:NADH-quinone oxidoreductase subunit M